jgi:hypothetical protein
MADIFLSYAREDAARAEEVAASLTGAGYDVFWDREIPPGTTWADYLEEKLTACKALVVLWSAHSTQSQWVREEARMARDRGKLLPAMLDASPPPFGFGEVQAADLTGWRGDPGHPDWVRLIAGLQRLAGGDAPARSAPVSPAPAASAPNASPPTPPPVQAHTQAPAAPSPDPDGRKKGVPIPLLAGIIGGLVLVGAVVSNLTPGPGGSPGGGSGISVIDPLPGPAQTANPVTQPAGPTVGSGAGSGAPAAGQLAPSVAAAAAEARSAADAAAAASQAAAANSAQGYQAAAAAQAGQPPFGVTQGPMGATAGDIAALQAMQPAAVMITMAQGVMFSGVMQIQDPANGSYTMDGVAALTSGPAATGSWRYAGMLYDFVGQTQFPGRFGALTRERGGSAGATGTGVITYAGGERYEGQYRTVGALHAIQLLRHGVGVLYAPDGSIAAQGRFENDVLVVPQ